MPSLVTLAGIDEAIGNLALRDDTLKGRLIRAIRSRFPTEESLATIDAIPPEELIRQVWETDDPNEVQQKRKNFSSLKSSLNKSLRQLSDSGQNSEGVVVGRDNTFIVSEEKKDSLLEQLGLGAESALSLKEAMSSFQTLFSDLIRQKGIEAIQELLDGLEQTKSYLVEVAREKGVPPVAGSGSTSPVVAGDDPFPPGGQAAGPSEPQPPPVTAARNDASAAGFVLPEDAEVVKIADEGLPEGEVEPPAAGEESIAEIVIEGELPEEDGDECADGELTLTIGDLAGGPGGFEADGPRGESTGTTAGEAGDGGERTAAEILSPDEIEEVELLDEEDIEEPPVEAAEDAPAVEDFPTEDEIMVPPEGTKAELAAEEEIEAGEVFFEDEIEETDLSEDDHEGPAETFAGPGSGAEGSAGMETEGDAAAEKVIEAEEIFYEDEIEQVELADEPAETAPEVEPERPEATAHAGGSEDADRSAGEPPAAGIGEAEHVVETEEIFYEDEIEKLEELLEDAPPDCGTDEVETAAPGEPAAAERLRSETGIVGGEPLADEETPPEGSPAGEAAGEEGSGILPLSGNNEGEGFIAAGDHPGSGDNAEAAAGPGPARNSGSSGATPTTATDDTLGLLEVLSGLMGDREGPAPSARGAEAAAGHEPYLAQLLSRFAPRHIAIPDGNYQVGSIAPQGRELPRRMVRLDAFRIGQFPITNDLFELFVRETGHETEAEKRGYGLVYEGRFANHTEPVTGRPVFSIGRGTTMHQVDGADWRHPAGPECTIHGRHRHPVVQVSLADAMAFARWAGKRLPTEEEWEAAAGAGDGRPFPWGNDWSPARANLRASLWGGTTPVDEHGPDSASPFGVYDLIGNVYEWTATIASSTSAGGHAAIYVLKGGSWATGGKISIAHRTVERGAHWSNIVGFRCAL